MLLSTIKWVSSGGKHRSNQSQSNQNRGVSLDFQGYTLFYVSLALSLVKSLPMGAVNDERSGI